MGSRPGVLVKNHVQRAMQELREIDGKYDAVIVENRALNRRCDWIEGENDRLAQENAELKETIARLSGARAKTG